MTAPSLFSTPEPLAARMRPRKLEEYVGQSHLLGAGKALGDAIRRGDVGSIILWGPPGVGKTTLARLIAEYTDRAFVAFSAVTEGVARVREIIAEAEERRGTGRGTILFCDEIHRFNRAQQDAFLPHVERGTVTLIGATTENPSFELNAALLSRTRVYVLEPLSAAEVMVVVDRALEDRERGLGNLELTLTDDGRASLGEASDGDARRALSVLEACAQQVGLRGTIDRNAIAEALARRLPAYDKSGEGHYNLISALHKAIRGSDPQAALYWLARMVEGGEDRLFLARRMVRMAIEDIGLAAQGVREAFGKALGSDAGSAGLTTVYDVCHNIAKFETHEVDGVKRRVCVHRKGATRAFPPGHPEVPAAYRHVGQPVLIPGDMGRYSFVLVGAPGSMAETFGSTCHGAGRVMSRTAAKKAAAGRPLVRELLDRGVVVRSAGLATIAEEMPEAYKDVAEVVEVVHGAGLSKKVARIVPMGVIKG